MRASRVLASGLAALLLALTSLASAQKVLLVQPSSGDPVLVEAFNRLRAELAVQGFETSVVAPDAASDSPEGLADLAKKDRAFAGISLTRRALAGSAEVCIADRVTGKISLRRVALDNGPDAPSVLAVRTTDLLRASLREFSADQKPPPEVMGVDTRPVPKEVQHFAGAPPARFELEVRAALIGLGQRLGPGYAPNLGLSYRVLGRAGFGLSLTGPALGASFETNNGSAVVRQALALGSVWLSAVQSPRFELRPMLGVGVYRMDAIGEVESPITAHSGHVTSIALGLGVDTRFRIAPRLALGAQLSALTLSPRPGLAVLGEQYLFPWPLLMASAGLGVDF